MSQGNVETASSITTLANLSVSEFSDADGGKAAIDVVYCHFLHFWSLLCDRHVPQVVHPCRQTLRDELPALLPEPTPAPQCELPECYVRHAQTLALYLRLRSLNELAPARCAEKLRSRAAEILGNRETAAPESERVRSS